ncbi:MAG: MobF family relaxase [Planctomycetia bacterium]
MLRITQSRHGNAKSYFGRSLDQGDYYTEGQEIVGSWGGRGARRLGLSGDVNRESFFALCENRNPTSDRRLTPRTDSDRTVGYDFTFDVPKSVSVLYARTKDERILGSFRDAVRRTMEEVEADAKTRVRIGGRDEERTTGNLVWAEFLHFTSRPVDGVPDPQLHMHCFTFNATFDDAEERWKAAQFREAKRDAPYYQAAFEARLARGLADEGVAVERREDGWELAGVSRAIVEKYSRRTALIEEWAAERGVVDPVAKAAVGARTREAKTTALDGEELRDRWRARLTEREDAELERVAAGDGRRTTAPATAAEAVDYALEHGFERASVERERTVLAAALRRGVGDVEVDEVRDELRRSDVIGREVAGTRWITTRDVLAEEREMVAFARDGRGTCEPLAGGDREPTDARLNAQQRAAVDHVLQSPDRVILLRGGAGTGKTTLMQEAVAAIEDEGRKVFTLAPSAAASRGVLRDEGFAEADTVASLLASAERQKEVRGGVLWVDEAGLLGTTTMRDLFAVAEAQDARVVLAGDVRQHAGVERGDALRLLEEQAGLPIAGVEEIQRQKGEYKKAVEAVAAGDAAGGFDRLDRLGWVREISDADERYRTLAKDYADAVEAGRRTLAVAPTHAEGDRVTTAVRDELRTRGLVGEDEVAVERLKSTGWTTAERTDPLKYRVGQIVQFEQNAPGGFRRGERREVVGWDDGGNVLVRGRDEEPGDAKPLPLDRAKHFGVYAADVLPLSEGDWVRFTHNGESRKDDDGRTHRLNNGSLHQVEGFTDEGHVRLANGWTVDRSYGHWTHGFTTTSHASQGKTVDEVFVAQSALSRGAGEERQFYVSASRGRERVRFYVDDKEEVRAAVEQERPRPTATELVGPTAGDEAAREQRESRLRLEQWKNRREPAAERERAEAVEKYAAPIRRSEPDSGRSHER